MRETTHDVHFLHNEQFFAAAQKKYVYIYDKRGIEVHCLKVRCPRARGGGAGGAVHSSASRLLKRASRPVQGSAPQRRKGAAQHTRAHHRPGCPAARAHLCTTGSTPPPPTRPAPPRPALLLQDHTDVRRLDFLPHHFLLVSVGASGVLRYQDTSYGAIVAQHRTKLGPCDVMRQNPWNAVMVLGHGNGTVRCGAAGRGGLGPAQEGVQRQRPAWCWCWEGDAGKAGS